MLRSPFSKAASASSSFFVERSSTADGEDRDRNGMNKSWSQRLRLKSTSRSKGSVLRRKSEAVFPEPWPCARCARIHFTISSPRGSRIRGIPLLRILSTGRPSVTTGHALPDLSSSSSGADSLPPRLHHRLCGAVTRDNSAGTGTWSEPTNWDTNAEPDSSSAVISSCPEQELAPSLSARGSRRNLGVQSQLHADGWRIGPPLAAARFRRSSFTTAVIATPLSIQQAD